MNLKPPSWNITHQDRSLLCPGYYPAVFSGWDLFVFFHCAGDFCVGRRFDCQQDRKPALAEPRYSAECLENMEENMAEATPPSPVSVSAQPGREGESLSSSLPHQSLCQDKPRPLTLLLLLVPRPSPHCLLNRHSVVSFPKEEGGVTTNTMMVETAAAFIKQEAVANSLPRRPLTPGREGSEVRHSWTQEDTK